MEKFFDLLWTIDYPLTMFVSLIVFLIPLRKRKQFWISFVGLTLALFGVWVTRKAFGHIDNVSVLNVAYYLVEIGILFLLIYLSLDVKPLSALIVLLSTTSIQHLSFKISLQLIIFVDINLYDSAYYFLISYSFLIFTSFLAYFSFAKRLVEFIDYPNVIFDTIAFALAILVELVFSIFQQEFMFAQSDNQILLTSLLNFSNIVLTALILLFLYMSTVSQKRKEDNLVLSMISEKERERFELAKITIDEINIKYHDLCHMMKENENNINQEDLKEIKETVTNYKAIIHTSNVGLNVVVYEAQLKCINLGIDLNVLIDGDSLAGFKNHHVYSMLSNLLSNSIEAVSKYDDKNKKRIFLSIKRVRESIFITVENPIEDELLITNGLPKTHKRDSRNHGFGLKSVKRIVDMYNGLLSIETKNNMFVVTIVFPTDN